ncbi:MAG TPA: DoxX family protein [Planctomycetota bacterium]|jgi:putative oxidoreductase|nr:DoxX family protein [Planctomycetota bacterium]
MADDKIFHVLPRLVTKLTTPLQPLVPLATRIVLGQAFVLTGLGKWRNFDRTAEFFGNIGIPVPRANAAFIATLELVGGACLILGFGTRIFSLLLSATMVVALMTADREAFLGAFALSPETGKGFTDVVPVVFLLFLLWLAAWGAGPISADHLLPRAPPKSD